MALYDITSRQEFDEKVLKNGKPVLVDFWAQWCPPCRAMAPILHQIAEETKFDVVKIDTEASSDNAQLTQEYRVQGIPNMKISVPYRSVSLKKYISVSHGGADTQDYFRVYLLGVRGAMQLIYCSSPPP